MEDVAKILSEIKDLINEKIIKHLPRKGTPQVLFDGCWKYFDYGGKRFRPALIAISCEALNGNIKDTIPAGAALEIAHTFFLIHDDIEDYSKIRRGEPTLHEIYGMPHAINMGDYLFFKVYEVLLSGKKIWGLEKTMKILEAMTEMFKITGEGQALEIEQRDKDLSEVTMKWYEKMALEKTGYYSGGTPCMIGGIIADGTEKQIESLKKFGFAIGIAFQIQDDILNITMSEKEEKIAPGTKTGGYGKDFAGDIEEGKRTLLLVHCFENADEKDKKIMKRLVGKKGITIKEKIEVINIMKKYGSIEFSKEYARNMVKKAIQDMRKNIPHTKGRDKLEAIATFLVERNF
jgi:geranylgeranyl diphosphate synthase type II